MAMFFLYMNALLKYDVNVVDATSATPQKL